MTSLASRMTSAGHHQSQENAGREIPSAILVVEDEPEILEPLCHVLRRAGYVVFEAEDGLSACRMIGSQHPDLILLDIMLPDLDGWELCRMLRQHPDEQVASTPVIMLTALNTPEDKLHGLQLGADAYLSKPYSQQEVLLLSGKLIERYRHQRELAAKVAKLSSTVEQQQDLQQLLFHELRNQLTVLHGYTELLQRDGGESRDSRVTAIHRSSDYLQSLAEDFLLIRQVQTGELRLATEPLLIDAIAAEMLELYTLPARVRGITLQWRGDGAPRGVVSNRPALRIILSALLDNAIKYGPANQHVTLACRFGERHFAFEVHDDGSGVASDDRERVFDRFYRSDAAHPPGGSGLGLYGVRILTRALGGEAEIDDEQGHGCCFRVWFPLAREGMARPA